MASSYTLGASQVADLGVARLMRGSPGARAAARGEETPMWLPGLLTLEQWMVVAAIAAAMVAVARLGLPVIGPNESGLRIKRYGPELPPRPVVAPHGQGRF